MVIRVESLDRSSVTGIFKKRFTCCGQRVFIGMISCSWTIKMKTSLIIITIFLSMMSIAVTAPVSDPDPILGVVGLGTAIATGLAYGGGITFVFQYYIILDFWREGLFCQDHNGKSAGDKTVSTTSTNKLISLDHPCVFSVNGTNLSFIFQNLAQRRNI